MIPVDSIFNCLNGNSGLTEEFIYSMLLNKTKEYEVLSSSTQEVTKLGKLHYCKEINGKPLKVFENNYGLLVARNGKAGKMTLLSPNKYTITDHAYILSIKKSFIEKYKSIGENMSSFLKYFILKYQHDLYNYSSKTDNATWNKTAFFNEFNIDAINKAEINQFAYAYDNLILIKSRLANILDKINKQINNHMIIDNLVNYSENTKFSNIFDYISRNDKLSKEGIYSRCPIENNEDIINILSGSSDNIQYGKVSRDMTDIHILNNKQGLHLVSRGKAGKLTYLPKGVYATNTNAFIIYVKDEIKKDLKINNDLEEEIFLKFMKIYLQPIFYEISSLGDLSVFPLTKIMIDLQIPKIYYCSELKTYVDSHSKLEKYYNFVNDSINNLENLMEKKLV